MSYTSRCRKPHAGRQRIGSVSGARARRKSRAARRPPMPPLLISRAPKYDDAASSSERRRAMMPTPSSDRSTTNFSRRRRRRHGIAGSSRAEAGRDEACAGHRHFSPPHIAHFRPHFRCRFRQIWRIFLMPRRADGIFIFNMLRQKFPRAAIPPLQTAIYVLIAAEIEREITYVLLSQTSRSRHASALLHISISWA